LEVLVSFYRIRLALIALCVATPLGVLGIRGALGYPITISQIFVLLLAGCVPVIVMLGVFRGVAPRTIAQVLYDTDQQSREMRPIPVAVDGRRRDQDA
jgi:hypothetical protein